MDKTFENIQVIGFDADDTLWVNETYFRDAEKKFAEILGKYEARSKVDHELYEIEIRNLKLYGYGIKGFMLSMVECAIKLSQRPDPGGRYHQDHRTRQGHDSPSRRAPPRGS